MATFVDDALNDTDGVALRNHTRNDGGSWTRPNGTSDLIFNNGTRLHAATTSTTFHLASGQSAVNGVMDLLIGYEVVTNNAIVQLGILFGWDGDSTGGTDGYMVRWTGSGTPRWELFKIIANVFTVIDTENGTPSIGSHTLRIISAAGSQKVLLDDVEILSTTDTTVANVGKRVGTRHATATSSTTGHQLSSFLAADSLVDPRKAASGFMAA